MVEHRNSNFSDCFKNVNAETTTEWLTAFDFA